jgi:general stress protein YciG
MTRNREGKGKPRGFAAMDQELQRAIARRGGATVPNEKRSFAQNRALAAEAGRKGGRSVAASDRSFSQNRALAAEAGRKGGRAAQAYRATRASAPARSESEESKSKELQEEMADGTDTPFGRN